MLQDQFELRRYDVRRIGRNAAYVFCVELDELRTTIDALKEVGLRGKNLKLTFMRWPNLATQPSSAVKRYVP